MMKKLNGCNILHELLLLAVIILVLVPKESSALSHDKCSHLKQTPDQQHNAFIPPKKNYFCCMCEAGKYVEEQCSAGNPTATICTTCKANTFMPYGPHNNTRCSIDKGVLCPNAFIHKKGNATSPSSCVCPPGSEKVNRFECKATSKKGEDGKTIVPSVVTQASTTTVTQSSKATTIQPTTVSSHKTPTITVKNNTTTKDYRGLMDKIISSKAYINSDSTHQPEITSSSTVASNAKTSEKSSSNTGLIVSIIVLGVITAIGLIGFLSWCRSRASCHCRGRAEGMRESLKLYVSQNLREGPGPSNPTREPTHAEAEDDQTAGDETNGSNQSKETHPMLRSEEDEFKDVDETVAKDCETQSLLKASPQTNERSVTTNIDEDLCFVKNNAGPMYNASGSSRPHVSRTEPRDPVPTSDRVPDPTDERYRREVEPHNLGERNDNRVTSLPPRQDTQPGHRLSDSHKKKRKECFDKIKEIISSNDLYALSHKLEIPDVELDDYRRQYPNNTKERAWRIFRRSTEVNPNLTLYDLLTYTQGLGYLMQEIQDKINELENELRREA